MIITLLIVLPLVFWLLHFLFNTNPERPFRPRQPKPLSEAQKKAALKKEWKEVLAKYPTCSGGK